MEKLDFDLESLNFEELTLNLLFTYDASKGSEKTTMKDVLIDSINKTIHYNVKTGAYKPYIPFSLWKLSKVCRFYKDEYCQFDYLVRACVSCFVPQREPEFIKYILSEFSYFYNKFQIPTVFTNDLKIVLSNNAENLPP